jgi:hypothetical protein
MLRMTVRPKIITSEDQLAAALRGRRLQIGATQEDVDARIRWPDGYCAKAEAPSRKYGRRVLWGFSALLDWWLTALDLRLVLVDRETAERLVAESDGADLDEAAHNPYPGRARDRQVVRRRTLRTVISFSRAA